MSKVFYTYIITNMISTKQYVGSHICYKKDINNDGYMGSSKYLNKDYKIYGKENFTKSIIKEGYLNSTEMLESESHYILKYNTLAPVGYNRFIPNKKIGFHMSGLKASEKTKEKMSKSHIGKTHSIETKEKMRMSRIGLKKSKETKEKTSVSRKQWFENNENPIKGRKRPDLSKNRKGKNNPMFGTRWVTNGVENTRILTNENIPIGWKLGRQLKMQKNN